MKFSVQDNILNEVWVRSQLVINTEMVQSIFKKKKNFTKATENGNRLTEQQPQCDISPGSRTAQYN